MRGRKPKLTFDVQTRIVSLVRAGNHLETAAGACAIHRTTLHRWLEKGEKQNRGKYHDFCTAVRQAQSECEARNQLTIAKAANGDWKAAAWLLERVAPQRYGKHYNAGKRETAEQMLGVLEKLLDPSHFAALVTQLQGGPASESAKKSPFFEQLMSELKSDRAEQLRKHSPVNSTPDSRKGET